MYVYNERRGKKCQTSALPAPSRRRSIKRLLISYLLFVCLHFELGGGKLLCIEPSYKKKISHYFTPLTRCCKNVKIISNKIKHAWTHTPAQFPFYMSAGKSRQDSHLVSYKYNARNLESERFHRLEMSQIKAEIRLRTNLKLNLHKCRITMISMDSLFL